MLTAVELSSSVVAALIAYALAAVCALILYRRVYNWQLKCFSGLIAVIPLYLGVRLLSEVGIRFAIGSRKLSEMAELAVAAMLLFCVWVLGNESRGACNSAVRMRLSGAAAGCSTPGSLQRACSRLRHWALGGAGISDTSSQALPTLSSSSHADEAFADIAGGISSGSVAPTSCMESDGTIGKADTVERRTEPRYPSANTAWIVIHDPDHIGTLLAEVLDVSRSGVRLSVPLALRVASRLEVNLGQIRLCGAVLWCRKSTDDRRFEAGMRVAEMTSS